MNANKWAKIEYRATLLGGAIALFFLLVKGFFYLVNGD